MASLTRAKRRGEPRLQLDRQRHHGGAPDHDKVMAQPQHGAQQRPGIGTAGQMRGALALGLGAGGIQADQRLADAVLQGVQGVVVASARQPRQQFGRARLRADRARAPH